MADKCDVCGRLRWTTRLHWVCSRCEEVALAAAGKGSEVSQDGAVTVFPKARRPFRQILVLALIASVVFLGETLILVLH